MTTTAASIEADGDRELAKALSVGTNDWDALIERAKSGDREAFALVYRARFKPVSRYVTTIVGDVDRAEDVVAEVFLRVWRKLPSLREISRFDAWLFRIAHHQSMDELRKRRPERLDDDYDPEDTSNAVSPEAQMDRQLLEAYVQEAMKTLSDEQREVVVLRFLQGFSHAEVGEQLGKSEGAVRTLQYRALGRLREIVDRQATGVSATKTPDRS